MSPFFVSFQESMLLESDARKQCPFIPHFSLEMMLKWFLSIFEEDLRIFKKDSDF